MIDDSRVFHLESAVIFLYVREVQRGLLKVSSVQSI